MPPVFPLPPPHTGDDIAQPMNFIRRPTVDVCLFMITSPELKKKGSIHYPGIL
jgi:hypothetical protein